MATNMIHGPYRTRTLPVANGTASGSPVVVGAFVGVALTAEGEGGNVEGDATVGMGGVVRHAVGTTTAVAIGGPIYITSAYALTPVATSNTLFGHALEAKGTSAGEVIDIELAYEVTQV